MSDAKDGQAKLTGFGRQEGSHGTGLLQAFLRQQDRLRRIAAGMGLAGADIDDVLQDVSVRVLQQEDRFEHEGATAGWLIRTTVNRCITEHRRRFQRKTPRIIERHPELSQASTAEAPDTIVRAAVTEELEIMRATMAEMDPSLLELLVLRYFCDMDSNEIGRTLGLNASTVRCRLREARMALAQKLLRKGVEP